MSCCFGLTPLHLLMTSHKNTIHHVGLTGAVYSTHLLPTHNYFTSINKEAHTLYMYLWPQLIYQAHVWIGDKILDHPMAQSKVSV